MTDSRETASVEADMRDYLRVEEQMHKLRQQNFVWFSSCLAHLLLLAFVGFLSVSIVAPHYDNLSFTGCAFIAYVVRIMTKDMAVTARALRLVTVFDHFLLLIVVAGAASGENGEIYNEQMLGMPLGMLRSSGLHVASRFCIIFCHIDPWVTIPFQVLYTTVEVALSVGVADFNALCLSQILICMYAIICSYLVESMLRGRIYALMGSADAESLVSSFQRLLRGVCDGEVLLDSKFKVAQESEHLQRLLKDQSLTGWSFEQLIVAEERHRFAEFIETSTLSSGSKESRRESVPFGLRVTFQSGRSGRVAADIYHVPVPGLFGAADPYHLIAFKEDMDGRVPDAEDQEAVPTMHQDTTESAHSPSESGRSSQAVLICPELEETWQQTLETSWDSIIFQAFVQRMKMCECQKSYGFSSNLCQENSD